MGQERRKVCFPSPSTGQPPSQRSRNQGPGESASRYAYCRFRGCPPCNCTRAERDPNNTRRSDIVAKFILSTGKRKRRCVCTVHCPARWREQARVAVSGCQAEMVGAVVLGGRAGGERATRRPGTCEVRCEEMCRMWSHQARMRAMALKKIHVRRSNPSSRPSRRMRSNCGCMARASKTSPDIDSAFTAPKPETGFRQRNYESSILPFSVALLSVRSTRSDSKGGTPSNKRGNHHVGCYTQKGGCYTRLGWGRVVFRPWRNLRVPVGQAWAGVPVGQAWAGAGQRGRKRKKERGSIYHPTGDTTPSCDKFFSVPRLIGGTPTHTIRCVHDVVSKFGAVGRPTR